MSKTHQLPERLTPEQTKFIANTFSALADPTRAHIVFTLIRTEQNVSQLAEEVGLSISAVSHHLSKLRSQRLVLSRREGNQVFYSIDDQHIGLMIQQALNHLDHVRENFPVAP